MKIQNDIYLAPKERFPEDELDRHILYRQLKSGEDRVARDEEPEETQELDPDEPSAEEMDCADEQAERMAQRWNGGAQ